MGIIDDNEWQTLSTSIDVNENGCLWLTVGGFYELSPDTKRALKLSGITYVGELIQWTESALQSDVNISSSMLDEIKSVVRHLGLSLGTKLASWPPSVDGTQIGQS